MKNDFSDCIHASIQKTTKGVGVRGRVLSPPGVAVADHNGGTGDYAVGSGQEGRKQHIWQRKNGRKEKCAARNRTRTEDASVSRTARDMDSGPKGTVGRRGQWATGDSGPESPVPSGPLNRTLRLALGTWEGEKQSLTSGILKGLALLVSVYGDSLDDEIFRDKVGKDSAKKLIRTARDRRPGTLGYAEAMILAYNVKNKRFLSMKRLYWNGKGQLPEEEEPEEEAAM